MTAPKDQQAGAGAPPKDKPVREKPARAFFESLFGAVLEEMERNPDFAERLAEKLSKGMGEDVALVVKRRRKSADGPPAELAELDLSAMLEEEGQFGLREALAKFTNAELGALIRARGLSSDPVSKLNKAQLTNLLVRAAKAG